MAVLLAAADDPQRNRAEQWRSDLAWISTRKTPLSRYWRNVAALRRNLPTSSSFANGNSTGVGRDNLDHALA